MKCIIYEGCIARLLQLSSKVASAIMKLLFASLFGLYVFALASSESGLNLTAPDVDIISAQLDLDDWRQATTPLWEEMATQSPPMVGEAAVNASAAPPAGRYSPVTLYEEWPKLHRLLFILCCSCIGSTMNGFFVAAFFVEHTLNRIGNVFLACVGFADLILTTTVMPVSAVVILSGQWDTVPVCKAMHFIAEISTYSYSIFFTFVAAETFYRLCRPQREYEIFISMRIGFISILVFAVSTVLAAVGVYLGLDYDYCERLHYGDFYYRMITGVIFYYIPFLITFCGLVVSSIHVCRRARKHPTYRRSQQYETDCSSTCLNITAFLLYVGSWTPYLIVVHEYPSTSDKNFYNSVWAGVCRSVVTSFLYSIANSSFRRAFAHLFNYCCCKSSLLYGSMASYRHRRNLEYKGGSGDVRVHIMHKAVNAGSPQRAASSSRETQEL